MGLNNGLATATAHEHRPTTEAMEEEQDLRKLALSIAVQLPTDEDTALRVLELARQVVTEFVHKH